MANPIPTSNVVMPLRRSVAFQHGDSVYTATLTGALTLTLLYAQWLALDCNGTSRVVTMPAPSNDLIGHFFAISNAGVAGNLYIKTSAGVLLAVLYPGDRGRYQHGASDYQVVEGWAVGRPLSSSATMKPGRYRRTWTAGMRGKPALNAVMDAGAAYSQAEEVARLIADPDFEVLGTNATTALSTFYVEGGLLLTTAGADGDSMILVPHLNTNQSAWTAVTWGSDQELVWECFIQSAANITNARIWAGLKLTNTSVVATDNDQVFFRYEDDINSGKWQAIDSIGGTDTATDTSVTAAVNTRYHLQIVIDSGRVARFYLNGALVRTSSALTDATDFIPYIGVMADGAAAAKALRIHGQVIERNVA